MSGDKGAQGYSTAGPAGPTGPAGPAGATGAAGPTGARGETLFGPTGPAGPAGPAGARGEAGWTGAQGSTRVGNIGPAGPSGVAGARGESGPTGAQGAVGIVDHWTSFRELWFDSNRTDLQSSEMSKVSEIADYISQNPSIRVGIDGSTDARNQDLNDRRVAAVRDALIQAGVPSSKIQSGAYGDARLAHDRRIEVLVRSSQ